MSNLKNRSNKAEKDPIQVAGEAIAEEIKQKHMVEKSLIKAKQKTEKRMSIFMGNVAGQLGLAHSQGTKVIDAEIKEVEKNQDLSRDWKIFRTL